MATPHGRALRAVVGAFMAPAIVLGIAAAPQSETETKPVIIFSHAKHVSTAWLEDKNGERLRDCRGCHFYGDGSRLDPQESCKDCHFRGPFEIRVTGGADASFRENLDRLREDDSPLFDHFDHDRLECKACHQPEASGRRVELDPLPVRRGVAECERCHAPNAPGLTSLRVANGKGERPLAPERFFDAINRHEAMAPEKLGSFSHADHLRDPAKCPPASALLGAGGGQEEPSCVTCHASTVLETDSFHGALFDRHECRNCHVSNGGPPDVLIAAERPAESRAQSTFSHADHVKAEFDRSRKKASAKAYDSLAKSACLACHAHGDPASSSGAGATESSKDYHFGLSPSPDTFEGCVACHDAPEWKPRHESWEERQCTVCHDFGGGDMKTIRPTVEVSRVRPEKFRILGQAHPLITSNDAAAGVDEDCAKCHRAAVRSLPSRIQEKPFNHATHLGPQPTAEDCLDCHSTSIAATSSSAEIVDTYDRAKCGECHKGGLDPVSSGGGETVAARVVSFPHRLHMEPPENGKKSTCVDCHSMDATSGGADYVTKPEATNCSGCHDHGADRFAVTGQASLQEVTSCKNCHADGARSDVCVVPEVDSPGRGVSRLAVSGAAAPQFHPPGRDCTACHVGHKELEPIPHPDHVAAQVTRRSVRARDPKPKPVIHVEDYGPEPRIPDAEDQRLCLGCHWSMKQESMRLDPSDAGVRRDWGDVLDSRDGRKEYPGWPGWPGRSEAPK